MRTLTDTLTAAQKRPSTRPHPKVEVFDKVAGITRFHWERLYEGAEAEKFHAVTMPGDGSLIRLRTDASNNLYRQRVTGPDEESTYSSWTDWSVEAYAVSLCSYGANVVATRIGTDGHLYLSLSEDNGDTWSDWHDLETIAGTAADFRLASCFKDATNFLILYSDGTDLYRKRLTLSESWTTPTGHNDPDATWNSEANAYDDDTGSRADETSPGIGNWGKFIELTHAAIYCHSVRLWTGYTAYGEVDIDIYYGGAWHDLYEGDSAFITGEWTELTFTLQSITKVRAKFKYGQAHNIWLRELDFGELLTDEAGASWANSLNSITGVAVVYQGDYNIIVTGTDPNDDPGVWTCVLGDGYSAAVGNWSSLAEVMLAESASGVTYVHPTIALPDVYRAWFVEAYSGTESYSRPYWTHGIASADFISNLWREPVPFNLTSSYGLSLAWSGSYVWLTRPDGVWRASVAAGSVELTTSVLGIKASAREATGEISVILRNDDGRFNSIGEDDDTYEHLKLGSELRFSPGYYTTDAGSPEHSSGPAYWIQSFDYLSKGGRSTLTVNAVDGWGLLERWKARRQYSWASGDLNIYQLLSFIHSRAGLEFSALGGSSSVLTDLEPAFTINPGESGKTAALRLLAMIPDVLFFRGYFGYLKYIQSSDSEDYTYGTDHAILEAHYHTSHKAANRVQVNSATIFTESFDWEEIDLVFDILEQDYDLALTTTARTGARATAIERRQTVRSYNGYSVVPLNCGQEIYDVVKLTDQRAPLSAEKRRLLGIDHVLSCKSGISLTADIRGCVMNRLNEGLCTHPTAPDHPDPPTRRPALSIIGRPSTSPMTPATYRPTAPTALSEVEWVVFLDFVMMDGEHPRHMTVQGFGGHTPTPAPPRRPSPTYQRPSKYNNPSPLTGEAR